MRRALALLIRLFPTAFRQQFGADMIEQVTTEYDRAAARGRMHGLSYAVPTAADLIRCALTERWTPTFSAAAPNDADNRMEWPMSGWLQDLRLALRALLRAPTFAVITIGTLGLAIGANAGIFSVVDAVLLNPLPYADSDRLVHISGTAPGSEMGGEFPLALEFWVQYGEQSRTLEDVAIYNSFTTTVRVRDRTERVRVSMPTGSLFTTLQATPMLGRLPVEEDESNVALISHGMWTTWFGSDPTVIGQTHYVAGRDRTIIGVMSPDFRFPNEETLAWIPAVVHAEQIVPGRFGMRVEGLVARRAAGVTTEMVAAELTQLARQLPERFGGSPNYARIIERHEAVVRPLRQALVGDISRALWVLMGSVGIVLLIASANVANLFLVRSTGRQREQAVRRAIGAGRARLFRSQMAEAVVVAVLGGALAVVLAWVSVPAILRAAPPDIPGLSAVGMSGRTLAFTFAVSLLAGLLCGLVPAVRASAPDMVRLRDGSRGSTRRRSHARDGLVVAQIALALVLLIGSGLLIRSFQALRDVDPGYDTRDILTFQIAPEGDHLPDGPAYARFHMDFMDRIRALPGVESVGVVENVPLNEGVRSERFVTEATAADSDAGPLLGVTYAAGDYFATMGINVLAGRPFTMRDHVSEPGSVLVSRRAAELLWPGTDPIGQRLRVAGAEHWETVVGVVENVMQYSFRDAPQPLVYFPLVGRSPNDWVISSPAYVVKTARAATIAPEIRALVRDVAPEAPMYRVYTMAGLAADSMVQLSFTMLALGITSLLALLLGTVGLYGVLSSVVAERTREIGVRMALGARAGQVRRMIVAQAGRVVLLGVAIGVAAALAITRTLAGLLFNTPAADVATFAVMSGAMLLAGLVASYTPARRASSVDPLHSLRAE